MSTMHAHDHNACTRAACGTLWHVTDLHRPLDSSRHHSPSSVQTPPSLHNNKNKITPNHCTPATIPAVEARDPIETPERARKSSRELSPAHARKQRSWTLRSQGWGKGGVCRLCHLKPEHLTELVEPWASSRTVRHAISKMIILAHVNTNLPCRNHVSRSAAAL